MDDHFYPGVRNNPYPQQLFYNTVHQGLNQRIG